MEKTEAQRSDMTCSTSHREAVSRVELGIRVLSVASQFPWIYVACCGNYINVDNSIWNHPGHGIEELKLECVTSIWTFGGVFFCVWSLVLPLLALLIWDKVIFQAISKI